MILHFNQSQIIVAIKCNIIDRVNFLSVCILAQNTLMGNKIKVSLVYYGVKGLYIAGRLLKYVILAISKYFILAI